MADMLPKDRIRTMEIFMPYAAEHFQSFKASKKKFVHYTAAENAIKILESSRIWMRNPMVMADYSEIQHGYDYLSQFFHDQNKRDQFCKVADHCHEGVAEEAVKLFDDHWNTIVSNTFITCVSEHDPKTENTHGRLSMWRAFDKNAVGVALVLNAEAFWSESMVHSIFMSPVSYYTRQDFDDGMQKIIQNIEQNTVYLSKLPREQVLGSVFRMFLFSVTCLKHPAFSEEQEWRMVYYPKLYPSEFIETSVETISGIPQTVHKIPLEDYPDQGLVGAAIPKLIDRIIIGPSEFKTTVADALKTTLLENKVDDPDSKIIYSNIPLRG